MSGAVLSPHGLPGAEPAPGYSATVDSGGCHGHHQDIVEKHADGYVAYPVGLQGAVVGEDDSFEAALGDVRSAIALHLESFGQDALEPGSPVLKAFVAEADVAG